MQRSSSTIGSGAGTAIGSGSAASDGADSRLTMAATEATMSASARQRAAWTGSDRIAAPSTTAITGLT